MELEPITRIAKDIKAAARLLSPGEARFLVDYYYALQEDRIRSGNQAAALNEAGEPNQVVTWLSVNAGVLERNIKSALGVYADSQTVGRWSQSIVGIGPILSAGLLAHIDIAKAPTVGHIWRFAGLDPTVLWEKKTKRPWNTRLKTLCWKIGESFVKVSGHEDDVYGKFYLQRKALEMARNEEGRFSDQAVAKLDRFKIGKTTDAYGHYAAGRLPPAHLHARAKRWVVKLFLAHWHHVAYETHFGQPPPKPYVLTHLGHVDEIRPPHWPM
jgi:hypothetical protein